MKDHTSPKIMIWKGLSSPALHFIAYRKSSFVMGDDKGWAFIACSAEPSIEFEK